jgi:hypothetical protein
VAEEAKNNREPLLEGADAFNELIAKHYELRVALNLIPVVGGALSELYGGRGSRILEERRDDFLRSLSEKMQDLADRAIKEGYFETEKGADVFRKAFEEALRTRSEAKRDLYARILRGAVLDYGYEEYSPEEYLHVISDLTEQEVRVALSLYGERPGPDEPWRNWGEKVCRERNLDRDDVPMMLSRIEARGLIGRIILMGDGDYIRFPEGPYYQVSPSFERLMRFLNQ